MKEKNEMLISEYITTLKKKKYMPKHCRGMDNVQKKYSKQLKVLDELTKI